MSFIFFILGFAGMEIFSWGFHKYIMHGPLWFIHKTHHKATKGFFELNDIFSLIFGLVAIILILFGINSFDYRFWLGCGITAYGFTYFLLHDMLIHRRVKTLKKPTGNYFKGISKAHQNHHKTSQKTGGVSFGLLWVPRKYFKSKA